MISVIIAAFNAATTIDRCVQSIVSAKKDHDIELIVIDDGSNDKTADMLGICLVNGQAPIIGLQ